jgi:type VI protein secretion system component VasK
VLDPSLDEARPDAGRSTFVPRFTIRTLLAILTGCALVFVMVGTATRGQYWAWGVTIGLISLLVSALTHAAWFGIVWMFAHMSHGQPQLSKSTLRQVMTSSGPEAASGLGDGERLLHDGQTKP